MIKNSKEVLKISKSSWLIHKKVNIKENIENSNFDLKYKLMAIN